MLKQLEISIREKSFPTIHNVRTETSYHFQQNPYLSYDRLHTILIYQHLAMISANRLTMY